MKRLLACLVIICLPIVASTAPVAFAQLAAPPDTSVSPASPPGPAPQAWVARGGADLLALDKVNARVLPLAGRVGQVLRYGTLSIAVRACVVRAPDHAPDAAVFVDITDANAAAPVFNGWMLVSDPSVSMLEHPIYDVRLVGCRG